MAACRCRPITLSWELKPWGAGVGAATLRLGGKDNVFAVRDLSVASAE
ncbi:MAG: hypothetical protein ACKESB_02250 [Candidatus Hodgkinia cicadicola]